MIAIFAIKASSHHSRGVSEGWKMQTSIVKINENKHPPPSDIFVLATPLYRRSFELVLLTNDLMSFIYCMHHLPQNIFVLQTDLLNKVPTFYDSMHLSFHDYLKHVILWPFLWNCTQQKLTRIRYEGISSHIN